MYTPCLDNALAFIERSLTPYHAQEAAKALLCAHGFSPLSETQSWKIEKGGKYYITRGGALIAFTVGNTERLHFKMVASHVDSPVLKLKANPTVRKDGCSTLNVETYGGGVWYSFLDRPLKLAGRVIERKEDGVCTRLVEAPYLVHIPSLAIHQNRTVNEGFAINNQVDLAPVFSLENAATDFIQTVTSGDVISYDLYAVSAQKPYAFGQDNALIASPRVDNLTSVYASLEAICSLNNPDGVCLAAFFHFEEVGSNNSDGAAGDFLEHTLKRIAYALSFDEEEYFQALASSFLLSVDNAHAVHPNHPEKSDITNRTRMGGGVVIKEHAGGAYLTDGLNSAIVTQILDNAGVKHQTFFNRSDLRSGSTLGKFALTRTGVYGADIGIAQLAMHASCECFAAEDYTAISNGIYAFYNCVLRVDDRGLRLK